MNTNETANISSMPENTRAKKAGMWALVTTAILLVALIVINVLVALLPATVTHFDTTDNDIYSVSSVTRKFLSSLKEDVTVYVVCEGGLLEDNPGQILKRYEALNRHIKVEIVDPEKQADMLAAYGDITSMTNYSMIVKSERRYAVVDFSNAWYYEVESLGNVPAADYVQMMPSTEMRYYYYYYYGIDLTSLAAAPRYDLETQLTGAIEYVTAPVIPHLCVLDVSREIDATMSAFIGKVVTEQEYLATETLTAISEMAAPLMIYAPAQDLSDATTDKILTFIADGGQVLLLTSPENATMPNLARIVAAFGVSPVAGVLYEGNANNFIDEPSDILATVNSQHDITYSLTSYGLGSPLLPNSHAIAISDTLPEGVSVTTLFSTSTSTYTVNEDGTETTVGSVPVGIAASNTTTGSSLVWLTSADALTDDALRLDANGTSLYYMAYAILWQSEDYISTLSTIEPVDISVPSMTVDNTAFIVLAVIFILAVPTALIVVGVVIRVNRSRR